MREGFVFYRSFQDSISEMPEEYQLQIYKAIVNYGLNGDEPNFNGVAKAIFFLIKPQIDANNKKYENGKKGGRPKENQQETKTKPNDNQNITKAEPKEKVKEKVKEKDEEKDESAGFAPPSFLSFLNFFTENGYKKETAQKAFDYYEKRNWKDSHNNSVKDWQDKCRRLWFKDSEKDPDRKLTPEELLEYNTANAARLLAEADTKLAYIEKTIGDDTDD
jgi:hypothetical protein